jgi:hypothetical protein
MLNFEVACALGIIVEILTLRLWNPEKIATLRSQ